MTKFFCDRCGTEVKGRVITINMFPTRTNAGGYLDEENLDIVQLCKNCAYDLGMWLANRVKMDDGRYCARECVKIEEK